jgi:hypothetical protein
MLTTRRNQKSREEITGGRQKGRMERVKEMILCWNALVK